MWNSNAYICLSFCLSVCHFMVNKRVHKGELTFDSEREVASDLRARQRVGGDTLVLALVTEHHVWNDQLLAKA